MLKLLVIVVLSFQLKLCSGQATPNEALASALSQICAKNITENPEITTTTVAPTSPITEAPPTPPPTTEAPPSTSTEAPPADDPVKDNSGDLDSVTCKVNKIVEYLVALKIKHGDLKKYLKKDNKLKLCQLLTPRCEDSTNISQEVHNKNEIKNSFKNTVILKKKPPKKASSSVKIKISTALPVAIVVFRVLEWK